MPPARTDRSLSAALLSLCAACAPAVAPPPDALAPDAAPDAPVTDAPAAETPAPPPLRNVVAPAPPASRVVAPGVRRESFLVAAPAPRPNAITTPSIRAPIFTPVGSNLLRVLRYRADVDPPAEVRAVVVTMPGFLGGAGSFDGLSRALVTKGLAPGGTPLEVWGVDRGANQLEDLRGMEAADALMDPEIARDYYLARNVTVNGERFAGFLQPSSAALAYMSEWGLETTINDLHAVVQQIPEPRAHAVLLGHSMGASIVEAYAAWDFDGTPGYRSIAGMAFIDGVHNAPTLTERAYYDGGGPAPGGIGTAPGVTPVRTNGPFFFALPLLGVRALVVSEIVARRAIATPDAVVRDQYRDQLFEVLLGVSPLPAMSNAAAMGFGFDNASCGLVIAAMSIGSPTGGPLAQMMGPFGGMVSVPSDSAATYRWLDAPTSAPREFVPLRAAAEAWAATPSNFSEWYFPTRLPLDIAALADLRLDRAGYAFREGIRAVHGGSVDVPVLAIGTGLVTRASSFDVVRARVTAAVGEGRPAAGATRSDPRGFRVLMVPAMTHIDPVVAPESSDPMNPVPGAIAEFVRTNGGTPVRVVVR